MKENEIKSNELIQQDEFSDLLNSLSGEDEELYKLLREFYNDQNIELKSDIPERRFFKLLKVIFYANEISYYNDEESQKLLKMIREYLKLRLSVGRKSRNEIFKVLAGEYAFERQSFWDRLKSSIIRKNLWGDKNMNEIKRELEKIEKIYDEQGFQGIINYIKTCEKTKITQKALIKFFRKEPLIAKDFYEIYIKPQHGKIKDKAQAIYDQIVNSDITQDNDKVWY